MEGGQQLPLSNPSNKALPGVPPVDKRPDIQVFKVFGNFEWIKPDGATHVDVICIGGGGGGGAGRKEASNSSVSGGGGGGQGGGVSRHSLDASLLDDTVQITVGQGGAGGVSINPGNTNGNGGTAGGNSVFGSFVQAGGGQGGAGGLAAGVAPAKNFGQGNISTGTNGAGNNPPFEAGAPTTGSGYGATGGGLGGFNDGSLSASGGGSFIASDGAMLPIDLLGGAGGVDVDGQPGSDAPTNYMGGTGGGGGGTSTTTQRNGGAGGLPGGGGGGGNTGLNGTFDSGTGGKGGDGLVAVITYR